MNDWGPPIGTQWLLSLLMVWWCEDGWARPDAKYAQSTRETLFQGGLLTKDGRATDDGKRALEWAHSGRVPDAIYHLYELDSEALG